MSSDMKIEVQHIPTQGARLDYTKTAETFPVLKQMTEQGECRFTTPVAIELNVVPERDLIRIDGSVSATVSIALQVAALLIMRIIFVVALPSASQAKYQRTCTGANNGEVELTAEQIGLMFFRDDTIELNDPVQEQIVLSIPYKPLCSDALQRDVYPVRRRFESGVMRMPTRGYRQSVRRA